MIRRHRGRVTLAIVRELTGEPISGTHRHLIQHSRFLEEMTRAGNDHQFLRALELAERLAVELLDDQIVPADEQECGGGDMGEGVPG